MCHQTLSYQLQSVYALFGIPCIFIYLLFSLRQIAATCTVHISMLFFIENIKNISRKLINISMQTYSSLLFYNCIKLYCVNYIYSSSLINGHLGSRIFNRVLSINKQLCKVQVISFQHQKFQIPTSLTSDSVGLYYLELIFLTKCQHMCVYVCMCV